MGSPDSFHFQRLVPYRLCPTCHRLPVAMPEVTRRGLLLLAAPTALSAMLNNAFRVIDQHAVQWLGVQAQAAIASCTFVLIGFFAVYAIVSSGTIPLVARAVGSGDLSQQRKLVGSALGGAALLGASLLTLSGVLAPWTTSLLGLDAATAKAAETYLRWHALTCFPQTLAPVIDAIFIAYGRTGLVLLLQGTATLVNFVLNPLFIYDARLGIGGAALATGVAQGIAAAAGLVLIKRMIGPRGRAFRVDRNLIRIVRIGLPVCWSTLLFAGVYWALLRVAISPLGAPVNAALGIGFSALEGFTWPVFWGFAMALASLIGRCLGAGQADRAKQAILMAIPLITGAGLLASIVFWLGADPLCRIFTDDRHVLGQAVLYAHILAFSQLFVAYEALAEGVLQGAGDTKTILMWSAPLNLLRVPLAWLFAIQLGYGAAGVWWAINLTTMIKAVGKWHAVAAGHWKTLQI